MRHVDPEVLALVALGEPLADDADRTHLAGCAECTAEVASLRAVVAVGRSVTDADALVAPSAAVWDRIRGELQLATTPGGDPAAPGEPAPVTELEPVTELDERRARAAVRPEPGEVVAAFTAAGATAAGLIVGGAGGALWASDAFAPAAEPAVLATAALDPLPGWAASGTALVEEEPDGGRVLVVTLDGPAVAGDFREVWLIDREVQRLVSLGVLTGSDGRFTVPAGLDLSDFAIVDISEEPLDGVPAHSGDSIVRGTLGA
ncbi:anti-sigma factor [Pengzhenrongella frigida]|uniref:anti-sigma factor n=1 Tax=Pengzhenrongella frigida TaxID=1259133 RepID=UPI001F5D3A1A|nr:anti-sigma factor [Cellulomonas sp. HLT2-17]